MNKLVKMIALMLVIALAFTGCFSKNNEETKQPENPTTEGNAVTTMGTEASEPVATYETIAVPDATLPEGEGFDYDFEETKPNSNQDKNEGTKPTDKPTDPTTAPTEKPTDPTESTTAPTEKPTEPTTPANPGASYCCEFGKYLKLSAAEQEAYFNSFDNPMDYVAWYQAAEAAHKEHDTSIEIEGGDLDIGDFMGGQG